MKKLFLSLIITINLVLSPVAAASEHISPNINIPLLILAALAILIIILLEVLYCYYFWHKNKDNKEINNSTVLPEMSLQERFDVALKTRNLEIDLFWKRSNYFLVLNTAIAIGFVSLITEYDDMNVNINFYIYALLFCVIGCFVCIAWLKVNLGSKFWQSHWEEILTEISGSMRLNYFKQSDENQNRVMNNLESPKPLTSNFLEKYYNYLVLEKPSVSKWMTLLSFFFLIIWFCIGGFISYEKEEVTLLIWILFWFVVRTIFGLFKNTSKKMKCIIVVITTIIIGCLITWYSNIINFISNLINI